MASYFTIFQLLSFSSVKSNCEICVAFVLWSRCFTDTDTFTCSPSCVKIGFIEVHQAEKLDGIQVQRLTIHYNCVGSLDIPDEPTLETPKVAMQTRKGVRVAYEPAGAAI